MVKALKTPGPDDKIAGCIKNTANWGRLEAAHRFDRDSFDPTTVAANLPVISPKMTRLIETIRSIDARDRRESGKVYKHFIYTDLQNAYGAKLIAAALASAGWEHAYKLERGPRGMRFGIVPSADAGGPSAAAGRFAILTSASFFERPIGIQFRRELLRAFNLRPENTHGEHIRIIVLDSGFREGVDLFDVRYIHIFEPILTPADERQAIGRATRFCGQKGLRFDPIRGWPLEIYQYETVVPEAIRRKYGAELTAGSGAFFDLFLKFSNIDLKQLAFSRELDQLVVYGAADRYLTRAIHRFGNREPTPRPEDLFAGGAGAAPRLRPFQAVQKEIRERFAAKYAWTKPTIENGCVGGPAAAASAAPGAIVSFTPTQEFIRHYFTPERFSGHARGMLLAHSVGTGKTCTAIALASTVFEPLDYKILYITRHTLKGDVFKNMFEQVCSTTIQARIRAGLPVPTAEAARTRLVRDHWLKPMSYRQFSNMITGKNRLGAAAAAADPLRKTLVIIDEAHKLFAPDVSGAERPDIDAIRQTLQTSYAASGADSARVLLMTATPYTTDPMDLIRLLNFTRTAEAQLPDTFDAFAAAYLNPTDGTFTPQGRRDFLDAVAGQISYLNREKDIRTFAYPAVLTRVAAPMSDYEFSTKLRDYLDQSYVLQGALENVANERAKIREELEDQRMQLVRAAREDRDRGLVAVEDCRVAHREAGDADWVAAAAAAEAAREECRAATAECVGSARTAAADDIREERAAAASRVRSECGRGDRACRDRIRADLGETVARIRAERDFNVRECRRMNKPVEKACLAEAKAAAAAATAALEERHYAPCEAQRLLVQERFAEAGRDIDATIREQQERRERLVSVAAARAMRMHEAVEATRAELRSDLAADRSQRGALEKCLSGYVRPEASTIIKSRNPLETAGEFQELAAATDSAAAASDLDRMSRRDRVYLISGHGSESLQAFERRLVMPADKALVVFPVCGRPNFMNHGCAFADVFNTPKYAAWLRNPVKWRRELERVMGTGIRIYLPGDRVPDLACNLFLNFNMSKTVLMKSGVYRLGRVPAIRRDRLPEVGTEDERLKLGSPKCERFIGAIPQLTHYTGAVHREVYRGNVYAPAAEGDSYAQLSQRHFKIADVMESVGSGIYYYIGCRSSQALYDIGDYERILAASDVQQRAARTEAAQQLSELAAAEESGASPEQPRSSQPRSSQPRSSQPRSSPERPRSSPGLRSSQPRSSPGLRSSSERPRSSPPQQPPPPPPQRGVARQIVAIRAEIQAAIRARVRADRRNSPAAAAPDDALRQRVAATGDSKLAREFADYEYILAHFDEGTDVLASIKTTDPETRTEFRRLYIRRDFPRGPTAKTLRVELRPIGYLLAADKSDRLKCDVAYVEKQMKRAFKADRPLPNLPKTAGAYLAARTARGPAFFEGLCRAAAAATR